LIFNPQIKHKLCTWSFKEHSYHVTISSDMWFLKRFEISANQKLLPLALATILYFLMEWKSHKMLRTIQIAFLTSLVSHLVQWFLRQIVFGVFECKQICRLSFVYIYISLEIQLSRGEGWDPINWLNPVTFLCLSQARTWISNIIFRGLFLFNDLRWEVIVRFVDIGELLTTTV